MPAARDRRNPRVAVSGTAIERKTTRRMASDSPTTTIPKGRRAWPSLSEMSMATAVSTLGAEGLHCKPQSFTKVSDSDGNVLASKDPDCDQVLDKEIARKTTSVLRQVVAPGATGEKAQVPGREIAGKTGTANDDTNAWFMGYTPQLASAVWQGHMSGTKTMFNAVIKGKRYGEVYGGLFPATIFSTYTKAALEGQRHLPHVDVAVENAGLPPLRAPVPPAVPARRHGGQQHDHHDGFLHERIPGRTVGHLVEPILS